MYPQRQITSIRNLFERAFYYGLTRQTSEKVLKICHTKQVWLGSLVGIDTNVCAGREKPTYNLTYRDHGMYNTMVGTAGFEPTTCSVRGSRATRLRYVPTHFQDFKHFLYTLRLTTNNESHTMCDHAIIRFPNRKLDELVHLGLIHYCTSTWCLST